LAEEQASNCNGVAVHVLAGGVQSLTPEVWGYFSVKGGGGIHEFSDSQVRELGLERLLTA